MSTENETVDWLDLDGTANARAVVPGVLLRSDNLQGLSEDDVRRLVEEEGLEVVLDLRTEVEVTGEGPGPLSDEPRVRVEHHSLHPKRGTNTDLQAGTVRPWGNSSRDQDPDETPIVRTYLAYLRDRPDSIVAAVREIARAEGAVLVHCAAGKDRTGVVVALALDAAGVDRSLIVEDYLATRERVAEILDRLLSSKTYRRELVGTLPEDHAPPPGTMERVLAVVDERYGGSAAWLVENGLSDDDLERLRARLAPAASA